MVVEVRCVKIKMMTGGRESSEVSGVREFIEEEKVVPLDAVHEVNRLTINCSNSAPRRCSNHLFDLPP
jgi:hypothetical protein